MSSSPDVLIVGAGLAGLCCARRLKESGISFQILEASSGVGGRVRTDALDGFLLDRGFQVFFTAYPEALRVLDYAALDLRAFAPGVLVWFGGSFHRVVDPWRTPKHWRTALRSLVGSLSDKLRVARLRRRLSNSSLDDIFRRPEKTTLEALRAEGFSHQMIDCFFRPLFAGILLDRDLKSSSRMFEFVFRMLSLGATCLPARGMGAVPAQLAAQLPASSIRTGARVEAVRETEVMLAGGEQFRARAVVVATEGPEAARLVGEVAPPGNRSVTCFYYAADQPPVAESLLVLNGAGGGPVNNMCVLSAVAPSYAPPGKSLVSVTVLGNLQLTDVQLGGFILGQLQEWFGPAVRRWQFLRSYRIEHAQPEQFPPALEVPERPVRIRPGLYVCGDHRDNASINGAMVSGRRAAEAVIAEFAR